MGCEIRDWIYMAQEGKLFVILQKWICKSEIIEYFSQNLFMCRRHVFNC